MAGDEAKGVTPVAPLVYTAVVPGTFDPCTYT